MRSSRLLMFSGLLMVGCASDGYGTGPVVGTSNGVDAVGASTWSPSPIRVAVGDTVDFRNATGITHNIHFDTGAVGHPADVPDFASGVRSVAFPTEGSFDYSCGIHPAMRGVVVVEP